MFYSCLFVHFLWIPCFGFGCCVDQLENEGPSGDNPWSWEEKQNNNNGGLI